MDSIPWKRGDVVGEGKQLGVSLRFVYGYLRGFILVSLFYIAVALTVILFDPEEFSLFIIGYVKTGEYNKLKITLWGHGLMLLSGMYELLLWKAEQKRKRRRRKTA